MACNTCGNDAGEAISFGDAGVERRCNHCNSRTDMGLRVVAPPAPESGPVVVTPAPAAPPPAPPASLTSDGMRYALARQLESLEATIAAGKAAEREAEKFRRLLAVLSAEDETTPNVSPIRAIQGAA